MDYSTLNSRPTWRIVAFTDPAQIDSTFKTPQGKETTVSTGTTTPVTLLEVGEFCVQDHLYAIAMKKRDMIVDTGKVYSEKRHPIYRLSNATLVKLSKID